MQARFIKAENNLKSLNSSVDLMKKESMKLLERATLAEKEMINGQTELMYMSLCTISCYAANGCLFLMFWKLFAGKWVNRCSTSPSPWIVLKVKLQVHFSIGFSVVIFWMGCYCLCQLWQATVWPMSCFWLYKSKWFSYYLIILIFQSGTSFPRRFGDTAYHDFISS